MRRPYASPVTVPLLLPSAERGSVGHELSELHACDGRGAKAAANAVGPVADGDTASESLVAKVKLVVWPTDTPLADKKKTIPSPAR